MLGRVLSPGDKRRRILGTGGLDQGRLVGRAPWCGHVCSCTHALGKVGCRALCGGGHSLRKKTIVDQRIVASDIFNLWQVNCKTCPVPSRPVQPYQRAAHPSLSSLPQPQRYASAFAGVLPPLLASMVSTDPAEAGATGTGDEGARRPLKREEILGVLLEAAQQVTCWVEKGTMATPMYSTRLRFCVSFPFFVHDHKPVGRSCLSQ